MRRNDYELDTLIAFILATAGRDEDWMRRSLGMIHLIKYCYLADLYATEAQREPLTGASWEFFHFGPWDAALHERIERSLVRVGAKEIEIPSRFGDDRRVWRWSLELEPWDEIRERLPGSIRIRLPMDIHRYANDTASLLDRVYKTEPMLNAAPRETLNLVAKPPSRAHGPTEPAEGPPRQDNRKRRKKLAKAREALAEKIQAWRAARGAEAAATTVDPPPRYDEVFAAGSEWLDSLAGESVVASEGVLVVDDSVWHSLARRGGDGG